MTVIDLIREHLYLHHIFLLVNVKKNGAGLIIKGSNRLKKDEA
jgi:hypothetical protein